MSILKFKQNGTLRRRTGPYKGPMVSTFPPQVDVRAFEQLKMKRRADLKYYKKDLTELETLAVEFSEKLHVLNRQREIDSLENIEKELSQKYLGTLLSGLLRLPFRYYEAFDYLYVTNMPHGISGLRSAGEAMLLIAMASNFVLPPSFAVGHYVTRGTLFFSLLISEAKDEREQRRFRALSKPRGFRVAVNSLVRTIRKYELDA